MRTAFIALCSFMSLGTLTGCPEEPGPKTPPPQPLVVGTSPPAPIATTPPSAAPLSDATEPASSGDAPRVMLGSLTTPGKVFIAKDRVVVVHFFATWCGPCKQSFPKLQALYAKHHARGLEVIAISVDDEETGVGDFARKLGVKFPVGWDAGHAITEQWKVQAMPTTFVINRDGNVAQSHGGYHDGEDVELSKEVEALF